MWVYTSVSSSEAENPFFITPFVWEEQEIKHEVQLLLTCNSICFYTEINSTQKIVHEIPVGDLRKTADSLLNIALPKGVSLKSNINLEEKFGFKKLLPNKEIFINKKAGEKCTIYEMLLCFFFELNNSESSFYQYNHHLINTLKENLEKCDVYKLICKKYKFYSKLAEHNNSKDKEILKKELDYTYNDYLDEILTHKLEVRISGQYLHTESWFCNPEKEIEAFIEQHKNKNLNAYRKQEMQNFLLGKHDVCKAFRVNSDWYWIPLVLNALTSGIILYIFGRWLLGERENTVYFLYAACFFYIIGMLIHFGQQRLHLSMFLPRIHIAVATGWFILVASEEILKNQLDVERRVILIGLAITVSLLLGFVSAEVRQHAPYYSRNNKKNRIKTTWIVLKKTMVILVFTFNFTVILGFFLHHFVVNKYILKSQVYEDYFFNNNRDSLNLKLNAFINFRNKLMAVQSANATSFLLTNDKYIDTFIEIFPARADLNSSDTTISVNQKPEPDESENTIKSHFTYTYREEFKEDAIQSYFNRIRSIDTNNIDKSIYNDIFIAYFDKDANYILTIFSADYKPNKKELASAIMKNDYAISRVINLADSIIKELSSLNLVAGSIDSLIHYDTYVDTLAEYKRMDVSPNAPFNLCVKNSGWSRYEAKLFKTKIYFFPPMLMFQTIIVMLIGIVGQLIISDKKVTEAL